jgi:hypothetical protein
MHLNSLLLFGFAAMCGGLASLVVWISPNPMPAGNAQLLAALIALMSAGGYGLIKSVTSKPRRRQ